MKTTTKWLRTWGSWALALGLVAGGLAGCGGDDDDSGGTTPPPPPPASQQTILDSFGRVVFSTQNGGDGSSGIGGGDSGSDGTAGDGAPIVGGLVTVTDSTGKSVTTTTGADGYYRVKTTGFVAPFVARVTKDGRTRTSLNVQAVQASRITTMNITGLTDKVASDVARAGGASGAAALTPQMVSANTAAIQTSIANLRTQLASVITAAGLNPATFQPLTDPFRADHTGHDFVLDNTVVTVDASGGTQVNVSPSFAGTTGLPGTWQLTLTPDGGTAHTFTNIPGSTVPTRQTVSQNAAAVAVAQVVAQLQGVQTQVNGNTVHATGPGTNYTITVNSATVTDYLGCGACGVGSHVTFRISINLTEGGTLQGQTVPNTTSTEVGLANYGRVN